MAFTSSVIAFGDLVRAVRKNRHWSQQGLAKKVGVCKRTMIDIENNTANPSFDVLCRLIWELDLPLTQIFYPELQENLLLRDILIEEILTFSEYETELLLAVVRDLRHTVKEPEKRNVFFV